MKYLIIATLLTTALGSVCVYAMDDNQKEEETRQLQLRDQRTPHIVPFLPVPGVANIASEYAAFTPEEVTQANNALWRGIDTKNVDVIAQALDSGAQINQCNPHRGVTALNWACGKEGYTAIVKLLLNRGADANERAKNGNYTPLEWACKKGYIEIVKILAFHGVGPSGQVSENVKTIIKQVQEARRELGDQNWLPQEP
ncbi:MAG: ankyrin repeat domain-containing protein [Candidatus Dependentiae bacterium]|nr:ankyrin repeat domain-containing protein [Candidatus Dependentiae bacterium]